MRNFDKDKGDIYTGCPLDNNKISNKKNQPNIDYEMMEDYQPAYSKQKKETEIKDNSIDNNIESLDGLNATIKAITLDSEEFTVEETNTSTRINVKYKDYEINVRNKRFFITENTKEKMLKSPKASGLNSAITFLRTNKPNHQIIYKKEQQKTY